MWSTVVSTFCGFLNSPGLHMASCGFLFLWLPVASCGLLNIALQHRKSYLHQPMSNDTVIARLGRQHLEDALLAPVDADQILVVPLPE